MSGNNWNAARLPSGNASPTERPERNLFESALLVDPTQSSTTTPVVEATDTTTTSPPTTRTARAYSHSTPAEAAQQESLATSPQNNTEPEGPEPRHCWICLTDEGIDSTDNNWRSPCPCNLHAHEECLLEWISDLESAARKDGTNSKILCPQCKSEIKVERPSEIFVLLEELFSAIGRQIMLPAGVLMIGGVLYSGSMVYGFNVLEQVFGADAGRELFRGVPPPSAGTGRLLEAMPKVALKIHEAMKKAVRAFAPFFPQFNDSYLFWVSPLIAPALLLSRTSLFDTAFSALPLPFLIMATYDQVTKRSATSPLITWPPSPSIVLLALPYIRSAYNESYHAFFAEREKQWRFAIQRQPREGETPEDIARQNADGDQVPGGVLGIEIELVEEEVPEDGFGLGPTEEERILAQLNEEIQQQQQGGQRAPGAVEEGHVERIVRDAQEQGIRVDIEPVQAAPAPAAAPAPRERLQQRMQAARGQVPQANGVGRNQDGAWEFRQNISVFAVARTVVATLMFPAVSSYAGDLLYYCLPKTWVERPTVALSTSASNSGIGALNSVFGYIGGKEVRKTNVGQGTWNRGLLQEKWGRTLVAGAAVVVLKDAIGLYVLWRRANIEKQRKVLDYVDAKKPRGERQRERRATRAAERAAREARAN